MTTTDTTTTYTDAINPATPLTATTAVVAIDLYGTTTRTGAIQTGVETNPDTDVVAAYIVDPSDPADPYDDLHLGGTTRYFSTVDRLARDHDGNILPCLLLTRDEYDAARRALAVA